MLYIAGIAIEMQVYFCDFNQPSAVQAIRNLTSMKLSRIHRNKFEGLRTEMNFMCTNSYKFTKMNLPSAF